MTHIYTTYESRETKDGKPIDRGINSMEFFFDGERWWCVQIYWDAERPGTPIPEKYLGKSHTSQKTTAEKGGRVTFRQGSGQEGSDIGEPETKSFLRGIGQGEKDAIVDGDAAGEERRSDCA